MGDTWSWPVFEGKGAHCLKLFQYSSCDVLLCVYIHKKKQKRMFDTEENGKRSRNRPEGSGLVGQANLLVGNCPKSPKIPRKLKFQFKTGGWRTCFSLSWFLSIVFDSPVGLVSARSWRSHGIPIRGDTCFWSHISLYHHGFQRHVTVLGYFLYGWKRS